LSAGVEFRASEEIKGLFEDLWEAAEDMVRGNVPPGKSLVDVSGAVASVITQTMIALVAHKSGSDEVLNALRGVSSGVAAHLRSAPVSVQFYVFSEMLAAVARTASAYEDSNQERKH